MLRMKEDKRTKEQFPTETQPKIALSQEKDGDTYTIRIRILFFTLVLLFLIAINLPLKYEGPKTENIISFFVSYGGTEDTERYNLYFERNYSRTGKVPLLFLDSCQEIFTRRLNPSPLDNTHCLSSSDSSQIYNYNIFDILSNINMTENRNNLKMNKEIKSIFSLRIFLYETVLDKDSQYLYFDISIIIVIIKAIYIIMRRREEKRREEKRREEKRREEKRREKIVTGGGAAKQKLTLIKMALMKKKN